jgi:chromosome segregation ATPase
MTQSEMEKRLNHYRLQLERLTEMHEARRAREDELRKTIQALNLQAEELRRQVWMLKYERAIHHVGNCHSA